MAKTSSTQSISIGVVVVGWNMQQTLRAIHEVDVWIDNFPGQHQKVLVANRPEAADYNSGWQVISGSNSGGEFSGFDEGWSWLVDHGVDVLLVLNDRYDAYGGSPLEAVGPATLSLALAADVIIGRRRRLDRKVYTDDPPVPHYIQTHFFVVGARCVDRIRPFAHWNYSSTAALLPPGWPVAVDARPLAAGVLDPAYVGFLASWLTGRGFALPSFWYRATNDPAAAEQLQRKATSIVNEHSLSGRAIAAGVDVLDVDWASRSGWLVRSPMMLRIQLRRWRTDYRTVDSRRARLEVIVLSAVASACHKANRLTVIRTLRHRWPRHSR